MYAIATKKKKSYYVVTMSIIAVCLAILLVPMTIQSMQIFQQNKPPICTTDEERVAWLATLGWEADATPISTVEVIIPETFDEIYEQYEILQRQGGYRLDKHKGKTATKYSYVINNYNDGSEKIIANILQRDDAIIGADLSGAELGGFMKPMLSREETQ